MKHLKKYNESRFYTFICNIHIKSFKLFESFEFICKEINKSRDYWDFISRYLNVISYNVISYNNYIHFQIESLRIN